MCWRYKLDTCQQSVWWPQKGATRQLVLSLLGGGVCHSQPERIVWKVL
jgi:hypothetical protein